MKRDTLRQIIIVIAVVATIVVNALANILPFNGQETGAISDRFAIYFVPAGYVFSIWGLIYLGLIAYAVFQALPAQRENPRLRSIGGLFLLSSVANIAWIFLWHYEVFAATLPVMLVLLGSLIAIYLRLGTGRTPVSRAETWTVRVPFSVYLGWITVATVANATQLLYFLGWNGGALGPEVWTVIMLAVARCARLAHGDHPPRCCLPCWCWSGRSSASPRSTPARHWSAVRRGSRQCLVAAAVVWSIVAKLRRTSSGARRLRKNLGVSESGAV